MKIHFETFLLVMSISLIDGGSMRRETEVDMSLSDFDLDSTGTEESSIVRWTEAAYAHFQSVNCLDVESGLETFTSSSNDCHRLQTSMATSKQKIVIYVAGHHPVDGVYFNGVQLHTDRNISRRLKAVLPDGMLEGAGSSTSGHHAVLVLDPYPTTSFGHLVLVFFIDYGWGSLQCRIYGGTFIVENGECLTMARKHRCHNVLERNSEMTEQLNRRCEIQFLPLVHLAHLPAHQDNQLLECTTVAGFGQCPQLRPLNETSHLVCNPLHANSHRCYEDSRITSDSEESSPITFHKLCRPFETCDHAVLIGGGGWNRDHSDVSMSFNIRNMFQMLRHNGFHKKNIKVFYANGARGAQLVGENTHFVYPSALKLSLRHHLQKVCRSKLCADSFVVYLNNPTRSDGAMLLWDIDGNGQSDENEVYRVVELMDDISNCTANQVYVLVDQSFAGELVKTLDRSDRHSNVMIIGSGRHNEYSFNNEFTKYWASLRNHSSCMTDIHQMSHAMVSQSHPTMHDGSDDTLRTTIFGAPCDVRPMFSQRELRQKYLGCQNVPTKVWINKYLTAR